MKEAVIFDMDGVIADSEYLNVLAKHVLLKEEGIEVPWSYHDQFLGTTFEYMWEKMKQEFHLKQEVAYYIQRWYEIREEYIEKEGVKPIPGVVDFIKDLHEKDILLAVASSSSLTDITRNMKNFGIVDCFQVLLSGEECSKGKPDPEIFLTAAKKLGKQPDACVVIEDSCNGVKAAKSAQMKCIGYANPNAQKQDIHLADLVIEYFEKISLQQILD